MSLDYVPTEAAIGTHRKLKIDKRAGLDSRKRRALPGFFGKVRNKGFGRDLDSRETDAADGDGIALLQFLRYLSRCHGEAALAVSVGNALDFPNFFNDACEHGPPNSHMISRREHSAFSQKTGWTLPWDYGPRFVAIPTQLLNEQPFRSPMRFPGRMRLADY